MENPWENPWKIHEFLQFPSPFSPVKSHQGPNGFGSLPHGRADAVIAGVATSAQDRGGFSGRQDWVLCHHELLVGGFNISKKYEFVSCDYFSQSILFPMYGKIIQMFQTTNQIIMGSIVPYNHQPTGIGKNKC